MHQKQAAPKYLVIFFKKKKYLVIFFKKKKYLVMENDQQLSHPGNIALIVGITGMVGVSLAESLKSPTAPGGLWQVYGASRRSLPPWFPSSTVDHYILFDATNKNDTFEKISKISHKITHLFWLAIHVGNTEEDNKKVNAGMLKNVISALTTGHNSALRHVCLQTGTKHYMGPIFDPTIETPIPSTPFEEDSPRLDFPNFYYALEDLLASYSPAFTYSIHRSSIILGASSRSWYNTMFALCAYAVICKHEGMPFRYPGTRFTWEHFYDVSDARVLAEQQIWAAVVAGDHAKNTAFNCTNGDVFTWKKMWKELSDIFDLEFVPFEDEKQDPFDWAEEMKNKANVWDLIVEKHGLYETKLDDIPCFIAGQLVLSFEFQHVCSMNKSRDHGFFGYKNTIKSVRFWVDRLRLMKIIP